MNKKESKEEVLLRKIIHSCGLILDHLEMGSTLTPSDFNSLGIVESSIFSLQKSTSNTLDFEVQKDVWDVQRK